MLFCSLRFGVKDQGKARLLKETQMNFVAAISRNMYAILGAFAMQTFCLSAPTALAAQSVNVNPAPQIENPYQVTESIPDSTTCAPQCIVTFPTVPNAKRLVITNVSAQLGSSIQSFVIEGNGAEFFVQKGYPTADFLVAPVTVYFEPGRVPTARFFVQDTTQHTSLIVTFVGYLVPVN
jgi:hypothetical protein